MTILCLGTMTTSHWHFLVTFGRLERPSSDLESLVWPDQYFTTRLISSFVEATLPLACSPDWRLRIMIPWVRIRKNPLILSPQLSCASISRVRDHRLWNSLLTFTSSGQLVFPEEAHSPNLHVLPDRTTPCHGHLMSGRTRTRANCFAYLTATQRS